MYCSKCGAAVADNSVFCGTCGQPLLAVPAGAEAAATPPATAAPASYAPAVSPPAFAAVRPMHFAGFWLRFVAYIVDNIIIGIPLIFVIGIIIAITGLGAAISNIHPDETPDQIFAVLGVGFIFTAIVVGVFGSWLYYALMESSPKQATLGKMALGLYVTDMNGQRLTFGRASGRYFGKIVTGLIPLAIGWIMAGFTAKKQALHDMIASCLVLRKE